MDNITGFGSFLNGMPQAKVKAKVKTKQAKTEVKTKQAKTKQDVCPTCGK